MNSSKIETILRAYEQGRRLSQNDVACLLNVTNEADRQLIYAAARKVRSKYFDNKVFLYGFVYFSTYCQNHCSFCFYRTENMEPPRYRKNLQEVVETAQKLKESGVHLIDLTTGDDPYYTKHPERLADIVSAVKEKTGLGVMVSPGLLDENGIKLIAQAGADWYALYQETHTRALFDKLRLGQSFDMRINAKIKAREYGMLVEEGLLTGVGDTVEDRVKSYEKMNELNASQVRTMTYIEQNGAPLKGKSISEYQDELLSIAVMRLLFPDILIPASLDVEGLKGLKKRIMAGANVVTSIIPPKSGYAGVANSSQDIDEGYRTVSGIQDTLIECGVCAATTEEYLQWIEERKALVNEDTYNWRKASGD